MSILSINNNMLAKNVANNLTGHYVNLAVSTQRLSTGLRINGAADDAAGLAIRELQRADIAALRQGMRNVNDAISMIQTFDGALGVIDEKLIRMKELAEQAATGTYDSTQRLMIDSEFQAMGSEIDRIARATDFNGIKLLNGEYSPTKVIQVQVGTRTEHVATADHVDAVNFSISGNGASSVDLNSANFTAAKYNNYLPTQPDGAVTNQQPVTVTLDATVKTEEIVTETKGAPNFNYTIAGTDITDPLNPSPVTDDFTYEYAGDENGGTWSIKDKDGNVLLDQAGRGPVVNASYVSLTAEYPPNSGQLAVFSLNLVSHNGQPVPNLNNLYGIDNTINLVLSKNGASYTRTKAVVPPEITLNSSNGTATYNNSATGNDTITVNLANGDRVTLDYTPDTTGYIADGEKISFDLNISGKAETKEIPIYENKVVPIDDDDGIPDTLVRIHFGTGNDQKEDYYDINKYDATLKGLGLEGMDIQTQDKAQEALVQIDEAIVAKDMIRAEYGATQNRLENTLTNITVQAENLQAAESRISDTEVAQAMAMFVRDQILTQSAVAMLAQANSMPQMVMRLIG